MSQTTITFLFLGGLAGAFSMAMIFKVGLDNIADAIKTRKPDNQRVYTTTHFFHVGEVGFMQNWETLLSHEIDSIESGYGRLRFGQKIRSIHAEPDPDRPGWGKLTVEWIQSE